jgi:hypothetical protein
MTTAITGIQFANKKALQAIMLEGLHPVFLTLFMCCRISVLRRVRRESHASSLPEFIAGKKRSLIRLKTMAIRPGRSSGSPALSATFPSRFIETVVFAAKRVLFSIELKRAGLQRRDRSRI